ncbi:sensor histidine kinase [Winogradskyella tangerina]|uniref:sensor histidine kinase n=1 Tax=Winogradskyella tangerina TaxID=2023240 RepID=UPI000DBE6D99|nr:two-component regulator propeller domain-containing protein [Winogradskyella tangerina]
MINLVNLSRLSLLTICVFQLTFLNAQNKFARYTASDGLTHDITYNIIQDSKGYIWIGTDDGLSKFDGQKFTNYGLKDGLLSNYVMDIVELPDYSFAISTWGRGLHLLENDTIRKSGKFSDQNSKIYDIKTNGSNVFGFSGSSYFFYNLKDSIFEKLGYKRNNVFGTHNEVVLDFNLVDVSIVGDTLFLHDQGRFKDDFFGIRILNSDHSTESVFPFLDSYRISAIKKLGVNNYICASDDRLIFTSESGINKIYHIPEITEDYRISKILLSPSNKDEFVLLAQDKDGFKRIFSYDCSTKKTVDLIQSLAITTTVSDATFDFEGNLWITTFGDGVYCLYYSNPKITSKLVNQYVLDLKKHKSHLYALTPSKVYKFDGDSLVDSFTIDGFAKKIALVNDEIRISALSLTEQINREEVQAIKGRYLGESKFGIIRQEDTIFVNEYPIYSDNEIIISDFKDEKNELALYTNKGKWNYNPETKRFYNDAEFQLINQTERINGHCETENKEYILTDKGLVIFSNNRQTLYNESNGLENERINDIFSDEVLYLATQGGLSVINNDEVLNFSKSFGLKSLSINSILSVGETLWLAGENGISIVNKNDLHKTPSPKIDIKQVHTEFKINTISFSNVGIVTQYQLNGEDWITTESSNNTLDFSSYAYDDYQLQFRSRKDNSDWIYSAPYYFKIKSPWYKIWWVILLFVLGSTCLLALLFYSRLKAEANRRKALQNEIDKRITAEQELSEVRDNIAQDFHDDLGNKLASISLLSDVLSGKVASEESAIVRTIKTDADYLYKGTKDFIFSLQEKSNYLDELQVYLSDFAEDYLHQFGIDFEVQSKANHNIKLPHYWSKQIIFIFKEAITNTVKYAEAKCAKMIFNLEDDQLIIEFTDDGVGFETFNVSSNGLNNMKNRAKKIDCNLEVSSSKHDGTNIKFIGKLP